MSEILDTSTFFVSSKLALLEFISQPVLRHSEANTSGTIIAPVILVEFDTFSELDYIRFQARSMPAEHREFAEQQRV